MRNLRLALYIFAGFWFGGLTAFVLFPQARERLLPSIDMRSVGQALVGGPFTLTDHTGKRVTELAIYVLEKPRHRRLVEEIHAAGARVALYPAGDVAAGHAPDPEAGGEEHGLS